MQNYKLTIAYEGTRYYGWQRLQTGDMSIQGKLEDVLSRMTGQEVQVNGSGRTDAGTHARGQIASVLLETQMSCRQIKEYLNHYLPEDIGVLKVEDAPLRFHARLNAIQKTYCYRVWNSEQPCVFERRYCYVLPVSLDLPLMRSDAADFLGTHDFRAFCANRKMKKSTLRTIYSLQIIRDGPELHFLVTGNGFLHHMVRIIVGTLLEVGQHQRMAGEIPAVLNSRDREKAGFTAPAQGLCLMEVAYE